MQENQTISQKLSKYRDRRKLSVKDMVDKIQAEINAIIPNTKEPLTLDTRTYKRWERGKTEPRALYRILIERLLQDI